MILRFYAKVHENMNCMIFIFRTCQLTCFWIKITVILNNFHGFWDIIDEKYVIYLSKFHENFQIDFIRSENDVKIKTL